MCDELHKIENLVLAKTNEVIQLQDSLYPICDIRFMNESEANRIKKIDQEVEELSNKYLQLYRKMSIDEQIKFKYQNLRGNYYQATHKGKGLTWLYDNSDEFELNKAFSNNYSFALEAVNKLLEAEKNNNTDEYNKNKRVIDCCNKTFSVHYWGKGYSDDVKTYESRVRMGRTIDDDIVDYHNLVERCKQLSVTYAKAVINGISEEDYKIFNNEFENIFNQEINLLKFVPNNIRKNIVTINLHWLKVDAEREPQQLLNDIENLDNKKKK